MRITEKEGVLEQYGGHGPGLRAKESLAGGDDETGKAAKKADDLGHPL